MMPAIGMIRLQLGSFLPSMLKLVHELVATERTHRFKLHTEQPISLLWHRASRPARRSRRRT